MKITVNAHASVRLETEQGIIYFDPFKIKKGANDADFIFITHSHFDHFSVRDIKKAAKEDTVFIVPKSMLNDIEDAGFSAEKIIAFVPAESKTVNGLEIEAVSAYNTNKPMHKKEYGWLGYVVTAEGKRIYVCGDTDATPEGEAVECDIAFVPAGGTYTLNAEEAAEFVNRMKPKKAIPYHYGSIVGGKSCGKKFAALVNDEIETELYI